MEIAGKLRQVNGRLKASQVGVAVEQHGDKLRLRATLPPKPGLSQTESIPAAGEPGATCQP